MVKRRKKKLRNSIYTHIHTPPRKTVLAALNVVQIAITKTVYATPTRVQFNAFYVEIAATVSVLLRSVATLIMLSDKTVIANYALS